MASWSSSGRAEILARPGPVTRDISIIVLEKGERKIGFGMIPGEILLPSACSVVWRARFQPIKVAVSLASLR